ncbi:MAG: aminomethyl-transferring glycine dehydrogenase subunit GcvPA [Elusimicrobia bacterium]|nr:aminomethyl-transferring glycine dehydrogenase subunit GcvPA [Elusimicrobiota bacterium]
MSQQETLLKKIGVKSFEDLLPSLPKDLLFPTLDLPTGKTEMELREHADRLAGANRPVASFMGAGAYDHFIPQTVWEIVKRGEFLTAYTPYQAEASQGTLLALFEFQTMISELFGMDVANASMYDGSTALAEALLLARRWHMEELGRRARKILIPRALHPQYKATLSTYLKNLDVKIEEIPYNRQNGRTDVAALKTALKQPETFAFVVSQPNFFGILEETDLIGELRQQTEALFICLVNNPISLGILNPPGSYNADIAVAEGQPLGLPLSFGGPYVGLFAAKNTYTRRLPGRICGRTVDAQGKTGYALTLQTREQHIRREKATSNICTNQTLCAVAATIYLSLLGPDGLREAAELTLERAHEIWDLLLGSTNAGAPTFAKAEFFQEFPFDLKITRERLEAVSSETNLIPGYPLAHDFPELPQALLIAATEKTKKLDAKRLVNLLNGIKDASNVIRA